MWAMIYPERDVGHESHKTIARRHERAILQCSSAQPLIYNTMKEKEEKNKIPIQKGNFYYTTTTTAKK